MGRVIHADGQGARVLPAAVADAHEQARRLVERAKARVDEMERAALARAREQVQAELAAEYLRLSDAQHAHTAELEQQLTALAVTAAEQLLRAELSLAPERIRDVITPLLGRVRTASRVTLIVHPQDGPAVERWLAESLGADAPVTVRVDTELAPGGCIVDSDVGTIDARVETRLAALRRAFQDQDHDR